MCKVHQHLDSCQDVWGVIKKAVQVIQEGLMACLEVATSGLLAVVLRGLAYCNDALRGCAYEALALYDEALEASDFRPALHDLHNS